MNWAQKYRSLKERSKRERSELYSSPEGLFIAYQEKIKELYSRLSSIVDGTMIQTKYHKIMIPKGTRDPIIAEKEKVDTLVLSDNDNELKLIPEGVHFIGVLGRLAIRAYKRVYSFNSIIEKRIKLIKEPYLFLIQDQEDSESLVWGYIKEDEGTYSVREVKRLTDSITEKILDEVFLSD